MRERRSNWKENLSRRARARHRRKMGMLAALDDVRRQISECGTDFELYDQLKSRQRQIVAQLATL